MMDLGKQWDRFTRSVTDAIHSSQGRDVLLYLLFLCVAFAFWLAMSLDTEVQREIEVPFEVDNVPDSITLVGSVPSSLSVGVQAKGYQLLRYSWGNMPMMKIRMTDYIGPDHYFEMSRVKIDSRLRDYLGSGVLINSVRPDSIKVPYTTMPGVKVKLIVDCDVHPALQYIISGPVKANCDSVLVYGINGVPRSLTHVETMRIESHDLTDTTRFEVRLRPQEGLRIIPDRVIVTVPVEPLISKNFETPVSINNLPKGTDMITFPSKAKVSYLVPMSAYNDECPVRVFVDFDELTPTSSRLKLHHSLVPEIYRDIVISPDSVEFIIERTQ
ncbi:MAG: hypothetical protein HDS91_04215 [Bacteroidales bacterium]|nr:hypothetical protein [Bacteroidales bacterium]